MVSIYGRRPFIPGAPAAGPRPCLHWPPRVADVVVTDIAVRSPEPVTSLRSPITRRDGELVEEYGSCPMGGRSRRSTPTSSRPRWRATVGDSSGASTPVCHPRSVDFSKG